MISAASSRLASFLLLFTILQLRSSLTATALSFVQSTSFTASSRHVSSRAFSSSTSRWTMTAAAIPPVPPRDDKSVVLAGVAPPAWKADLPRQSESSTEKLLDPPVAIQDPYGWMRDEARTNTQVLDHLKAENVYTQEVTGHLEELRGALYQEMLSTIQETDYTTPRPDGAWWYYTRTFTGKSYTVHCRAPKTSTTLPTIAWDGTADSPILPNEQIVLDVNKLAEGKSYCATGSVTHSPSHKFLAYSVDWTGGETCLMYVVNLETGEVTDHDETLEMDGSIRWGADDETLFYTKLDAAHRPFQAYKRKLGQSNEADEMMLQEMDDLYWMGLSKTLDGRYLLVEVSSKETTEIHSLDLKDPTATLQCVAPKRNKVLYDVEHRAGRWWIESNVGGLSNMALFSSPVGADTDSWELVKDADGKPLFDGSNERALDGVTCFASHVVASGREGGIPRVWIASTDGDKVKTMDMLSFPEEAYDVGLGRHYEFESDTVVVAYDSMVTPTQSLEIRLDDTTVRTVLKERKVPGYDKDLFACERTTVTSRDGKTEIPVSLVYRKDVMEAHVKSGEPIHTHLYGYGSYGACMEADFTVTRLPLLNRGIVYVIAHVRGGAEMGRQWYEEPNGAKYMCKKNTFNDFCDVARFLIDDRKLTAADRLSCEGRSAGGLLIGASINQAPELFKMAILGVPFVDVACTMVDASIPLTAVEWEEWGNPNEDKYHQYMMEYSPVNNVQKAVYPACLLTGGLHDPRVQFWEPSKFAAELRHSQADGSGPVCLKMDLSAGHFSASDRYKYLKELAFDFAFLLDQVGLANKEKQ